MGLNSAKGKTKVCPCVTCGESVTVTIFATAKKVKCPAHKGLTAAKKSRGRRSVLDPFEDGLTHEQRDERLRGAVLQLRREIDSGQAWEEVVTATGLKSFDEELGVMAFYGVGGTGHSPPVDPDRECGQNMTVLRHEVVGVR